MSTETAAPDAAAPKIPKPRVVGKKDPLTEDGVLILCRLAECGVKTRHLAYAFQIPADTVRRLVRRDSWKIGPAMTQQVG